MQIAPLSTERLDLSAPCTADIPEIVRLANNFAVVRNLARLPYPYGPGDAEYFLEEVVPAEPNWRVARKSDAVLLGFVGLQPLERESVVELGYWFGEKHWGRGYATEAASAVVAHAFRDLSVQKVLSGHFAANPASGRVLAKIGFREVGRSRRYSQSSDADLPHVDYVLERSEWTGKVSAD
ncbi:MAG: GNAT family N-acetyltransferase [Pseudomonadota bacterium]